MNSHNGILYYTGGALLFLGLVWKLKGLAAMLMLIVTAALGYLTYRSYDRFGLVETTGIFAAAAVGAALVLWVCLKSKAETPAEDAPTRKGKKAKAHA